MVFLFCFLVTHSYGVSFELCKWAMWHCKELISAIVFLNLWAGFWQEKLRHYRDRRCPKPNFLLQQYTSLFVRMRRSDEEKEKKPGWHKFVGEWGIWWLQYRRYLGCHFGVCKCQLLRATPTSDGVPIQTLCRRQSSLLWIDLYKRRRRRRRRRRKCYNTNSGKKGFLGTK